LCSRLTQRSPLLIQPSLSRSQLLPLYRLSGLIQLAL
jgi:hypothetical protein